MSELREPMIAGIELGGTKCIALLAIGTEIVRSERIATTTPDLTLARAAACLASWEADFGKPAALGIASFGPIGLDKSRGDYGRITKTPKPGWSDTEIVSYFAKRASIPVGFDTDVAGAALAEGRWGAAQNCDVVVYLTIGTGIGGGLIIGGRPVHGLLHPEMGHVRVRRRSTDDFAGNCPFHGDCLEGLASGPAISRRTGKRVGLIPHDDLVWQDVACEIAELITSLIYTVSPSRIVIGGGVVQKQGQILPALRERTAELLAGYVQGIDESALANLIVPAGLGDKAGPLGAIALGLGAVP